MCGTLLVVEDTQEGARREDHMARRVRGQSGGTCAIPERALLMKGLVGLIQVVAKQLDPQVLQEVVRDVGEQLGRQALPEYCLARHATGRLVGYTWAECLKEIAAQFGWTLRVAVESEGVIRVTVLGCRFGECEESGSYLCEFGSGLFGGAMAEAIGDVKVCVSECSETPPRHCVFAIYYRESAESLAAPGVAYPGSGNLPAGRAAAAPVGQSGALLTPRETQILRHVAQGFQDKQIAVALQVSVRTVENHAARIRKKLGVGNRAALVRFALRAHLVGL